MTNPPTHQLAPPLGIGIKSSSQAHFPPIPICRGEGAKSHHNPPWTDVLYMCMHVLIFVASAVEFGVAAQSKLSWRRCVEQAGEGKPPFCSHTMCIKTAGPSRSTQSGVGWLVVLMHCLPPPLNRLVEGAPSGAWPIYSDFKLPCEWDLTVRHQLFQ